MSLPSTPSRATPVPRVGHIQPGYRSPPLPNSLPHRSPSSNTSPPTRIGLLSSPSEASRTLIPTSLGLGQGNQPHLVSLVLQSKKALQHGEQLCARAHTESNASAQAAVDILTLDARVKWLVEAVVEQLKLAAGVAKRIEEKRAHIQKEVDEWDTTREKHTDALETVLESLGSQLVPPEFHQTSADSSLFGSQHGSDNEGETNSGRLVSDPSPSSVASKSPPSPFANQIQNGAVKSYNTAKARSSISPVSPSVTLRRGEPVRKLTADLHVGPMNPKGKGKLTSSDPQIEKEDRRYWKSLRDFVDDQGIEDTLDTIERDRLLLDDILSKTDDYPETLTKTINSIQASLPEFKPDDPGTLKQVQGIINAQEHLARSMASALMSLASHYDNMATALKESENGEAFTDKELQVMNRDTEELRAIMLEMEADMRAIEGHYEHAEKSKNNLDKDLEHLTGVLDKLDELGEIMEEMLQTQDSVEIQAEESLNGLQEHLTTLGHFHEQFVSYRMAFNKLMLEIARRRQYREAAEDFVRGMMRRLDSMTEEENRVRTHFNDEYGPHLPEDICLCIGNAPTKWEVIPWDGTSSEVLPFIANDLIAVARERVGYSPKLAGHDNL